MYRFRLISLILMFTTFFFMTNSCGRNQGERQNDNNSLGINFQLFNEKYKNNQNLQILDTRTLDEYKSRSQPPAKSAHADSEICTLRPPLRGKSSNFC